MTKDNDTMTTAEEFRASSPENAALLQEEERLLEIEETLSELEARFDRTLHAQQKTAILNGALVGFVLGLVAGFLMGRF